MIKLTLSYGRTLTITEEQWHAWTDDILEEHGEIMRQPLTVSNPFAFCAPEIIRGAVTHYILKTNIQ